MGYKENMNEKDKRTITPSVYGSNRYVFMEPLDEDMLNEIISGGKRGKCSLCPFRGICG